MRLRFFINIFLYISIASLTVQCGEEAYSEIYFNPEGIQGYNRLDPETTFSKSYYVFERDLLGNIKEITHRIAGPEFENQEALLLNSSIRPSKDDPSLFIIEDRTGTLPGNKFKVKYLRIQKGKEGVRVFKLNERKYMHPLEAFHSMALQYESSQNQRVMKLQGVEGSPSADPESGIHAERSILDDRGRVIKIQYLDAEMKPLNPFNGKPFEVRMRYSGENSRPVGRSAFDTDGKPAELPESKCHKEQLTYNEEGQLKTRSCLDREDNPALYDPSNRPYHQVVYSFNEREKKWIRSFRDEKGKPALEKSNQIHTRVVRYGYHTDPEIKYIYIDERDKEATTKEIRIQQEAGRLVRYSCFENSEPSECWAGWHRMVQKFKSGQRISRIYYDSAGEPTMDPRTRNIQERWTRDSLNRIIKYESLNEAEELTIPRNQRSTASGVPDKDDPRKYLLDTAGYLIEYKENSNLPVKFTYIGTNGEPMAHPEEGFAIQTFAYPEEGTTLQCQYDAQGKPENVKGGNGNCLRVVKDSLGRPEARYLLKENGDPANFDRMGHHREDYTVDDRGRLLGVKLYDDEGNPSHAPFAPIHEIRYKVKPTGRLKEAAFFDREGKPAEDASFTHRRVHYFERGEIRKIEYYRKDGSLRRSYNY